MRVNEIKVETPKTQHTSREDATARNVSVGFYCIGNYWINKLILKCVSLILAHNAYIIKQIGYKAFSCRM